MNKVVLTDTGFWLGLLDNRDQYHEKSIKIAERIEKYLIIFPFPCLYETISTRLARRREKLIELENLLKNPALELFSDDIYKMKALEEVFQLNKIVGFTYSLTDSVIREILKDIDVKIDFLITFNRKDFEDICQLRQIEIIDENF